MVYYYTMEYNWQNYNDTGRYEWMALAIENFLINF